MHQQTSEKREVHVGIGKLDFPLTRAQALRYGERNMPADLKAAGFKTTIFASDPEINGGSFFRINYGKTVPVHRITR